MYALASAAGAAFSEAVTSVVFTDGLGAAITVVPNTIVAVRTAVRATVNFLSHNHQFNWWFTLGPDKGRLLLPPKGGMLQACYWFTTKWYYSLLSSIRHSALQCTFYRRFCDITNGLHIVPSCPKRFIPFALQIRVSVINHQCALPLQISHEV